MMNFVFVLNLLLSRPSNAAIILSFGQSVSVFLGIFYHGIWHKRKHWECKLYTQNAWLQQGIKQHRLKNVIIWDMYVTHIKENLMKFSERLSEWVTNVTQMGEYVTYVCPKLPFIGLQMWLMKNLWNFEIWIWDTNIIQMGEYVTFVWLKVPIFGLHMCPKSDFM